MRHIFIGDVQACFDPLMKLLEKLNYDSRQDRLCFCGDLVGRGPQPLKVLDFIMDQPLAQVVLGNHDIFLLMLLLDASIGEPVPADLREVVDAPHRHAITQWLLSQPLLKQVTESCIMVHAGVPPQWSIEHALMKNQQWQKALASTKNITLFFESLWNDAHRELAGGNDQSPLSYTVNAFSRMRFCNQDGELDFTCKRATCDLDGYRPWYRWRQQQEERIIFGHWSALSSEPRAQDGRTIAMDTGCVFGGCLSAYCLEQDCLIQVSCH